MSLAKLVPFATVDQVVVLFMELDGFRIQRGPTPSERKRAILEIAKQASELSLSYHKLHQDVKDEIVAGYRYTWRGFWCRRPWSPDLEAIDDIARCAESAARHLVVKAGAPTDTPALQVTLCIVRAWRRAFGALPTAGRANAFSRFHTDAIRWLNLKQVVKMKDPYRVIREAIRIASGESIES